MIHLNDSPELMNSIPDSIKLKFSHVVQRKSAGKSGPNYFT